MFFDALMTALSMDLTAILIFLAIVVIVLPIVLIFAWKGRAQRYHYYCEFKGFFYTLAVLNFVCAVLFLGFLLYQHYQNVPLNRFEKHPFEKQELLQLVQKDYATRKTDAKTDAQRKALRTEYENMGYRIESEILIPKGKATKIPARLVEKMRFRDGFEKKLGQAINVPDVKKNSKLQRLSESLNKAALKALDFWSAYRCYVWFGFWTLVSIFIALFGIGVSRQGTEEQIVEDLQQN